LIGHNAPVKKAAVAKRILIAGDHDGNEVLSGELLTRSG
jgi:hypothetical protein